MPSLIQLIYASAARGEPSEEELTRLLAGARRHNAAVGVTGMLLYSEGSFLQLLEGEAAAVDDLLQRIARDSRHASLSVIIREPIARRSFGDWTMGFATVQARDLSRIAGLNDFFAAGSSLAELDPGRARKVLEAFKKGRWRSRLTGAVREVRSARRRVSPRAPSPRAERNGFSFAFQPIIRADDATVVSYEALIRGPRNEPAAHVLQQVSRSDRYAFDEASRCAAIELAAELGLGCSLNLNLLPLSLTSGRTSMASTLEAAERCGIAAERIVLEIVESEIIHDHAGFVRAVHSLREGGLRFAIDDFGAGYAGLNLLAEFQPDILKLDMALVRAIDRRGPRQAIVRGISRACQDLGIEVVAEGVETPGELCWCRDEGLELFQGNLIAEPAFEQLPAARVAVPE